MKQHWKIIGIYAIINILMLAGCKEKRIDYTIEGQTETPRETEQSAGTAGVGQFADAERWQDSWAAEDAQGKSIKIDVDADIVVPQADQMYVVSVSEPETGESYREDIANRCFTDGAVYNLDEAHRPKEWWKEEIDRLEEFMLQAKEEGNESSYEVFQEQIAECQAKWEQAPDSYQPVETYDVDEYMGYRDGISYELSVQNSEDNGIGERSSRIALMARDMYEVCPKRMEEVSDLTCRVGDTAFFEEENECGFTVEQAKQKVQALLEELGFSYPTYVYSRPLVWGSEKELVDTRISFDKNGDYCVDGYEMQFDLGVGDVAFRETGVNLNLVSFSVAGKQQIDTSVYSADSYVLVDISKKGIVYLYAENPAVIENISNPVRLLPLDTIKGIMQAQVEQDFAGMKFEEPTRFSNTAYNRMELIYFRMADKKNPGYYSYVPVWRLAITSDTVTKGLDGEKRSVDWVVNEIMVNAMDGSIVTLAEDYFGV